MKRRAFTLVELVVALAIFSLLLGGIFYALFTELTIWNKLVAQAETQQITNAVLSKMTSDVRSASEILPASNSTTLALTVKTDEIEYSLANDKIRRKKNGHSSYLTDENDIDSLSFSYPESNFVEVGIGNFNAGAFLRN
ncbi:MAG: type II secretion system protein [Candidatus Saganbacteria bacterium]|nr:type II secretion system protein [Candidatus Saganbacteria bacterium]